MAGHRITDVQFTTLLSTVVFIMIKRAVCCFCEQEPMKSRAPQLHLEYRFYKQLGQAGRLIIGMCLIVQFLRDSHRFQASKLWKSIELARKTFPIYTLLAVRMVWCRLRYKMGYQLISLKPHVTVWPTSHAIIKNLKEWKCITIANS